MARRRCLLAAAPAADTNRSLGRAAGQPLRWLHACLLASRVCRRRRGDPRALRQAVGRAGLLAECCGRVQPHRRAPHHHARVPDPVSAPVCRAALQGRRRRVLAVPLCAWRWATPVLTAFPAASHLPRPLRCLPSGAPCQIGWDCCGAPGEACRNVDNTSGGECGPACTVFKPSGAACNPAADCCAAQSETCNDKGDGPKCQIP